jgi:sialic acid synthase SpsE
MKNILIARKSIHLRNFINAGNSIKENDLIMKRPGTGISPMKIDLIIGKKAAKDLPEDHMLNFKDLLT